MNALAEKKIHLAFILVLIIACIMMPVRVGEASLFDTGSKVGSGDTAPPFTMKDLKGNEVNLSEHLGQKVILLDFWSIYCAPCVEEMPGLIELYNKYNGDGLEVFGISLDSHFNARRLNKFVESFDQRIPYPIIHDAKSELRRLYGVSTLPTTIIVGVGGKVKLFHIGFQREDKAMIDNYIRQLMTELDGGPEVLAH